MHFSQAVDTLSHVTPDQFTSLSEVLYPELIEQCLHESGTVTLCKRRLPLEMVVWSVVGMALFRHLPMCQVVNQLDAARQPPLCSAQRRGTSSPTPR